MKYALRETPQGKSWTGPEIDKIYYDLSNSINLAEEKEIFFAGILEVDEGKTHIYQSVTFAKTDFIVFFRVKEGTIRFSFSEVRPTLLRMVLNKLMEYNYAFSEPLTEINCQKALIQLLAGELNIVSILPKYKKGDPEQKIPLTSGELINDMKHTYNSLPEYYKEPIS